MTGHVDSILRDFLADVGSGWSLGVAGALAEFARDPAEPAVRGPGLSVTTARGGIAIAPRPGLRLTAAETPVPGPRGWRQSVSLCLPRPDARMAARPALTELGPDPASLSPTGAAGVLFDLGLGIEHVDACVRVQDAELLEMLRRACGQPLFQARSELVHLLVARGPDRVFFSRLGRIEVSQPIPRDASPDGPHTHLLPALMEPGAPPGPGRRHPENLRVCMELHPAHPLVDAQGRPRPFDAHAHARFQSLLGRVGDPARLRAKRRLLERLERGEDAASLARTARGPGGDALILALRQHRAVRGA
jgi:hypothetical protein